MRTEMKLPPRKKFYGVDYSKGQQLRMSGKEWHQYARRELFRKSSDAVYGNRCEIWLDGEGINDPNWPLASGA